MNILITGASRGIGLATAKKLASKGHSIGLFSIDEDNLNTAIKDKAFKKAHKKGKIIYGTMDVSNADDWDNAISLMFKQLGGIDVLINNAGVLITGNLPKTDLEQQLSLIDVNCKGVLIGCHKVASQLTGDKYSKIINLSSASAIYGQPEIAAYSASKFFVRGLTEALNIEYEPMGVRVVDVMPLWVRTDMTSGIEVTSIDRLGIKLTADDVAKTVCKLVAAPNKKLSATHYPVGLPAKVLNGLAQVTPDAITRWVNKKVGA
ncbi:SDR family NAD(P)-dependent oxidoreductase [Psychrobacter sp. I-STPA10]|uniref:SDR family NAD(P)-dependent oxidoreductase n=1 Tax=Psychrobacter sp. I-STPA10 TaxID=2585769 RepID=UPI001E2DE8E0|nr:SDR family NAD(P)-dependent oxidoreductase [Psychrobacter sp. I-STPA10]